jgi:hypothetical protein
VRAREDAVLGEHAELDLGRGGHAQDHNVACPRERRRALGFGGAAAEQILDRLPVAVPEHGQPEAFGQDVLGHAVAHQAGPDQADPPAHLILPLRASHAEKPSRPGLSSANPHALCRCSIR